MKRPLLVGAVLALLFLAFTFFAPTTQAAGLGMHVLRPQEFSSVGQTFDSIRKADEPLYITVPFSLDDRTNLKEWQKSFDYAHEHNIIPIVRLVTHFDTEKQAWSIPTRRDIILLTSALGQLTWPQDKRHVILYNEPNHAAEWGGTIDPHSFAEMTVFGADWLSTEPYDYVILPAALDLAASDTKNTKEAFAYWSEALGSKPEILEKIDAWNSHSYPNPAFSSAPGLKGKNRLDGFRHELAFLKKFTDRELPVFITETGWVKTPTTAKNLTSYYRTALSQVWSDKNVVAVTPFLYAGAPGPFAAFSFVDETGKPTAQWQAFSTAVARERGIFLTDRSVTR